MDWKRLQMSLTDLGENQILMFSDFCHVVKLFLYVLIKTSKQNYAFSDLNTENIWSFSGRFCTDIIKPIQFLILCPFTYT